MTTPGKIPKNISGKKIKNYFQKYFFSQLSCHQPCWPRCLSPLASSSLRSSPAHQLRSLAAHRLGSSPASQLRHHASPQDPQLPCAGCGQPPQLCRIFPAQPQLIGCAADIPGTASAPDQPGSTAPSLQIIPAKAQPIRCALLPLSSVACPILRASCPG